MRWPFGARAKAMSLPRPWIPSMRAATGEPPASYVARVEEAYGRNAIAQRAVRLVAEALGHAPLVAAGEEHPASALLTPGLRETIATQLLLHGNAFVATGLDHQGLPACFWTLRPETMAIETGADGWPRAYLQKVGNATVRHPAWRAGEVPSVPIVEIREAAE